MTLKKLTLCVIAVLSALVLTNCTKNQMAEPAQIGIQLPVVSKTVYTNLNLPAWLLTLPEGENSIGIVVDSNKKKSAQSDAAREFAALSLSKNVGSFEFDKTEVLKFAEQVKDIKQMQEFKVTLKSDSSYPGKVSNLLKPLAETAAQGYQIYLFATDSPELNNDKIKASAGSIPKWCRTAEITEDDEYVYVVGKAVDSKLNNAWKTAQNNALNKLAQYRLQSVASLIKTANNPTDSALLLDSLNRDFHAAFAKTWFFHKTENNAPSYNVFIMLKEKK